MVVPAKAPAGKASTASAATTDSRARRPARALTLRLARLCTGRLRPPPRCRPRPTGPPRSMRPFTFLVNGGTILDVGVPENETRPETGDAAVVPYLPRITLEWLRDAPAERHRALNGTMAFVDVSGFTAMSERLAPKGRLGAEEVTDVMSATFGRLLAVAYELGGGL